MQNGKYQLMSKHQLFDYFDRVVVLNLKRRRDRLEQFRKNIYSKGWPFLDPIVFNAIDGHLVPCPEGWESGGGAWGCMQSHRQILERALMDGVQRLLVLEDDCKVKKTFVDDISIFLRNVPPEWDQLMLGGQHHGPSTDIGDSIFKCTNCQRTHAYAVTPKLMQELYKIWHKTTVHCDWVMGQAQLNNNVYAPKKFVFGQARSQSDINGAINPAKFWIPPDGDETIIVVKTSKEIVDILRRHGLHTGYDRAWDTGIDSGLQKVFEGRLGMRSWVDDLMWEVVSEDDFVLGVFHPDATIEYVKTYWSGPVKLLQSDTAEDAIKQFREITGIVV